MGRVLTTAGHYAYLMIADGCSTAAPRLIPQIRESTAPLDGKHLEEAKAAPRRGARKLIIVAQDTTRYGVDLYGRYSLVRLLRNCLCSKACRTRA